MSTMKSIRIIALAVISAILLSCAKPVIKSEWSGVHACNTVADSVALYFEEVGDMPASMSQLSKYFQSAPIIYRPHDGDQFSWTIVSVSPGVQLNEKSGVFEETSETVIVEILVTIRTRDTKEVQSILSTVEMPPSAKKYVGKRFGDF